LKVEHLPEVGLGWLPHLLLNLSFVKKC
jgi:hypothetical protein